MEAGEDSEPMVSQEKAPEVSTMKAKELEVIVEDPNTPAIKTKVRIKVLVAIPLLSFSCRWCAGNLFISPAGIIQIPCSSILQACSGILSLTCTAKVSCSTLQALFRYLVLSCLQ